MPVTGISALQRGLGGPQGLGETVIERSDDGSVRIDASSIFGDGINWFGTTHAGNAIYINTNGSVSFGRPVDGLPGFGDHPPAYDMIGAFWGDVDTRLNGEGRESGQIWVDMDTATDTLSVTWENVGVSQHNASTPNSFQIQITDQGSGNVDVTLRYASINWTIGTADTDGGARALLGGLRLPEALDTGLGNTGTAGLWYYEMRSGTLPGATPVDGLALEGTAGNNVLTGGARADVLRGLEGNDVLRGEAGPDWLFGGDGADTLNGGTGDDFIFGGSTGADLRDVVYADDGNDRVDGGYGNDQIFGGNGNDTLTGGFGVDELIGQDGNDELSGGPWSDLIFGGAGSDFINGGFGFDRVNGGEGADRFFHLGVVDHGSDWIQDYSGAQGDWLMWGGPAANASHFQINAADTAGAGLDGVAEAFVIYRPTGQIIWALVDGMAQDDILLRVGTQTFDLMG